MRARLAKPHTLDLGTGDVHVDAAEISTRARKALPGSSFALPKKRAYPIHDAAHVRNAAARLEQAKRAGKVSPADYAAAKAAIARAAKRFGIESKFAKPGRKLHIRADIAEGGSLHVRHMSDRIFLDSMPVDATAIACGEGTAKPAPVWIQVAKPGTFRGHPAGPFTLDEAVFKQIVANFNATDNKRVPIDFEHVSEQDPTQGSIPVLGAPAQGWFTRLEIRGVNLWGLVEWGDRAAEYIKSGAYRYLSPAIRFGAKDRVTGNPIGAKLTSAALTNSPFLDSLQPLAAKDVLEANGVGASVALKAPSFVHGAGEFMPRIRAALRTGELCSAKECSDALETLAKHYGASGGTMSHEGIDLSGFMRPLADLVGASMGDTWDDVFDVVRALIRSAIGEHETEEHGEGSDPDMADLADQDPEMTMEDEMDLKEITAKLDEKTTGLAKAEAANVAQAKLLSDAETSVSKLTLTLADREKAISEQAEELKLLREEKVKRDEADLSGEVEAAFSTYKDKKGLAEGDKVHMTRLCKADREAFRGLYPPVLPEQRHLLSNMTDHRAPAGAGKQPPNFAPPPNVVEDEKLKAETTIQTTKRLMSEKKLPFPDAQNEAVEIRRAAGLR